MVLSYVLHRQRCGGMSLKRTLKHLFDSDESDGEFPQEVAESVTGASSSMPTSTSMPLLGVASSTAAGPSSRSMPLAPSAQPNKSRRLLPVAPWPVMLAQTLKKYFMKNGKQCRPFNFASACTGTNSPAIALSVPVILDSLAGPQQSDFLRLRLANTIVLL